MAIYTVEQFVKTGRRSGITGRMDSFGWRFVKTGFKSYASAAEYARAHPDYDQQKTVSGFRVTGGETKQTC